MLLQRFGFQLHRSRVVVQQHYRGELGIFWPRAIWRVVQWYLHQYSCKQPTTVFMGKSILFLNEKNTSSNVIALKILVLKNPNEEVLVLRNVSISQFLSISMWLALVAAFYLLIKTLLKTALVRRL